MITNSCRITSKTARKPPSQDSSSDTPVWCIPPRAAWCAIRIWPKTSPRRYSCCWLGRRAGWEVIQSFRDGFIAPLAMWHRKLRGARAAGATENNYAVETMSQSTPDEAWRQIEPLLDEAMANLSTADHDAVVLRYFESRSLREVGAALGSSEDAAQKRIARALERLRMNLARRGVTVSATALAAAVTSGAVQSAPAGLAVSAASLSLAAATGTSSIVNFLKVMTTTNIKYISTAVVIAALSISVLVLRNQNASLRRELAILRTATTEASHPPATNSGGAQAKLSSDELRRLRKEHLELLSLRGRVHTARQRIAAEKCRRNPGRWQPESFARGKGSRFDLIHCRAYQSRGQREHPGGRRLAPKRNARLPFGHSDDQAGRWDTRRASKSPSNRSLLGRRRASGTKSAGAHSRATHAAARWPAYLLPNSSARLARRSTKPKTRAWRTRRRLLQVPMASACNFPGVFRRLMNLNPAF